jgi:hypothetical protein
MRMRPIHIALTTHDILTTYVILSGSEGSPAPNMQILPLRASGLQLTPLRMT